MLFQEIKTLLENELSPKKYSLNSEIYGLHYGEESNKKTIKRILLTVYLNLESLHFAIKNRINLIISIHGLINKPINQFDRELINKLTLLSKYPIQIFVLDSSFIATEGGISDTIMETLYLRLDRPFMIKSNKKTLVPIGRICIPNTYPGNKKELTLEDLITRVKSNLDKNNILYVGNLNKKIEKVGIIGGEVIKIKYIKELIKYGCDCFISGELNLNIANYGEENGICIIRVSLFQSKIFALRKLHNFLCLKFPYEEFFFYETKNPIKLFS